jgi:hypothetical protein
MANPISIQKIMTGNGLIEIPIYSLSDVDDSSLRIKTPAGVGTYDLVQPSADTPLRILTSSGIMGINLGEINGGAEPINLIDFNNYSTFGVATILEEDTDDYVQVHTDSNGNGLSFPFTAMIGNVLTCNINLDIMQGVDDVISVRLWNATQNKWITTNMKTGTVTSGLHSLTNSFTLTSNHLTNGDNLELRIVQSWKNNTHDDFIFKVMKDSTLTS